MEDRHQAWLIRVEVEALQLLLALTSAFNDAARHHKKRSVAKN